MHITLRAGEKIYINGSVLQVDRKVTIELMNEAAFLLEAHVLQAKDATTPLRQLYFSVQMMLMDPSGAAAARQLFTDLFEPLVGTLKDGTVQNGLRETAVLVAVGRYFEALKAIRSLFPIEAGILTEAALETSEAAA